MRLPAWIARRLPGRDELLRHRWLAWLAPRLSHPRLWHANRRGIALGLAIGLFFGLVAPVAQIPFAVAVAVCFRANLPAAIASTLVTNPLTFAPIYYIAYQVGALVLGHEITAVVPQVVADRGTDMLAPVAQSGIAAWVAVWYDKVLAAGKPLVVGMLILAVMLSLTSYLAVSWYWRWRTSRQWRQRRYRRLARSSARAARTVGIDRAVRESTDPGA